jgi:hypothetical protein
MKSGQRFKVRQFVEIGLITSIINKKTVNQPAE